MTAFVAFLRGVNVGKANRLPMAEFRRVLETFGCQDVVTLLNSGNAVFRFPKAPSAKVATDIASAIAAQLQVTVPVVVKAFGEYSAIMEGNPFAPEAADHSRLLVAFTQDAAALASLRPLAELAKAPEQFALGKHAAYVHLAKGGVRSRLGAALLGKAGAAATTRNWATCLKLHQLLQRVTNPA